MELAAAPTAVGIGAGATPPAPLNDCAQTAVYKDYRLHFQTQDAAGQALAPNARGTSTPVTDLYLDAKLLCDTVAGGQSSVNALGFYLTWVYPGTGASAIVNDVVPGSLAGAVLSWTVDRNHAMIGLPLGTAAAGDRVGNLYGETIANFVVAGGGLTSPPVKPDRAPNADFGTPFVFPSVQHKPTYLSVNTPDFTLAAKNPVRTNQTAIYNWTNAEADLDLSYASNATSGTARVTVTDAAGATVLNQTLSGKQGSTVRLNPAATGKWQVKVVYANYTGDLSLSIAKHTEAAPSTSTSSGPASSSSVSSSSSGSTTAAGSGTTTGKGTPGFGAVGLLAALGLLAVSRRR